MARRVHSGPREMLARDVMSGPPETCLPHTDLAAVTRLMWDRDCGAIPVVDAAGHVVGIVTDRDICIATATRRLLPEHIAAAQVMSRDVRTCLPGDTAAQALAAMKAAKVRRLPVVDATGHLHGMLSITDVIRAVGRDGGPAPEAVVEALAAIGAPRALAVSG